MAPFMNKYSMGMQQKTIKWLLLLLILSSAFTVHAQNINTPNKMGPLGTEVNTHTGNLYIPRNDIYVPGRGFDFTISFSYNSFNFPQDIGFGNGWGFDYFIKCKDDTASGKTIVWGDGREDNYTALPGGTFRSPKGFFNTLTQYQAGKFLLTKLDGAKFYFDNNVHKKITRMEEPNGNYINFNYTDSLLTSIVNTAGQSISLNYDGSGRLTTVVDAITAPTRTYTYAYDGSGNLVQVTDPLGGTNKYSYLINGPMKTITDKNSNTVDIIYYSDFTISELIGCNKRVSFTYDSATNITVVTDHLAAGNNQVTKYGYKKFGDQTWLASMTGNCCGFNMKFEFDSSGNKTKETDANGNVYNYTYDARGNLLTTEDPLNQVCTYTYSSDFNQVTSYTDPPGNLYTLTYDVKGNLTQLTEPGNNISTATYNAHGDIISSIDPKGNVYTYAYDTYGNPATVTGPNGYHATLANDARGNLVSFTDARGNTHTAQYDILNRLKKITDPINNAVQVNYDAEGNATSVMNKNNETSIFNYDASDRMVKFTDPMGHSTEMSYDGMDNPVAIKNALGNAVNFTYDNRNRLSNTKDALNNNNVYGYDANGNITSITLPNGQQITYTYDNLDRLVAASDINGTLGAIVYDKNDNITSITNGTGAVTTVTYDNLDRITRITDPLGYSSLLSYDKNDNIISATDMNGITKTYTYDSLNQVRSFTDNNGSVITVAYDVEGNIIQAKDQDNNITSYTYDSLNRMKVTTYPDGNFMQFGYDKNGNIVSKRLTDGTTITYQYDSLNRVTTKTLPDGQVYSYGYDAIGRVISATNNNGTVAITYDALDRISSETFDGRTTRYNYNIAGRTQTTIYPDSTIITKSFDTRNRLISIAKNNTIIVSYQYNNASQVINKTFANGVSTNLQYDFANRLSNISTAGGSIQNSSFTYDKERNKTAINRQNNPSLSEQFTYDNGHRLINYKRGEIGGTPSIQNVYSYDAVGNRTSANLNGTSTTYAHNNLNQLTNSNNGTQNINFVYDNNGNLTYDGIFYKSYDAEGRLMKDSSSVSNVLTYQYDAFGRRVQKNFNGTSYKYTYSGLLQIEERNGATNSLLGRTIFSNFLSPVLNEKNNNSYYYHQNELNSIEAITNSAGNLTERYQYDVYGTPTIYDGSNNVLASSIAGNRFGFTGQEYDSANGTYRFHFRNYSPSTGTFNQRDLIGYGDGMGMYQYVHDNPANGVDPFGLNEGEKDPCAGKGHHSSFEEWLEFLHHSSHFLEQLDESKLEALRKVWANLINLKGPDADLLFKTSVEYSKAGKGNLRGALNYLKAANEAFLQNNQLSEQVSEQVSEHLSALGKTLSKLESVGNVLKVAGGALNVLDNLIKGGEFLEAQGGLDKTEAGGRLGASLINWDPTGMGASFNIVDWGGGKMMNAVTGGRVESSGILDFNKKVMTDYYNLKAQNETDYQLYEYMKSQGKLKEFFAAEERRKQREEDWKESHKINDCPQNLPTGGVEKQVAYLINQGIKKAIQFLVPGDPNELIGPDGVPDKHWVSVHDRLPYTVLYENSTSASAPAKFVRITSPIEPKEDASTFQLGSFGFNSQTFTVPPNTASYYQRLNCIDSLGLYVDITAGYDQINNQAFWEFQSIDPVTLLPPPDPLRGFLLLQDTSKPLNGHAFVNFSIKPLQTAVTLDTIGAIAKIVFDSNDTIPTNIAKNTIDAFAPTTHMNNIPATSGTVVALSWNGADDVNGCGLKYYTLYVSTDGTNFNVLRSGITRTDTTFTGTVATTYYFFVLGTDSVGNTEVLRPGEIKSIFLSVSLPITWLYFKGTNIGKDNLLEWATGSEQNTKQFIVERSLDGVNFSAIGSKTAAGNSSITTSYNYTDYNVDRLNSSVMYYRLREVDLDGHFKYSNIIRLVVNNKIPKNSIVYPNPTQGLITIEIGNNTLIGTQATLFDESGRMLQTIKITATAQTLDLSKYLNGVYYIRLSNKEVLRVMKQQ